MAIKLTGTTIIDDNRAFISYGAVHNALGSISGATTINLQNGNYVSATIAAATTVDQVAAVFPVPWTPSPDTPVQVQE